MLPLVVPIEVSASPFLAPPATVVGSPPQLVMSPAIGSEMKTAEMMLASAAAVGVSDGGVGGAPPVPGWPQLKMPPLPLKLTAPAGHTLVGEAAPELAQSYVVPAVPWNLMFPSTASHVVGAARTACTASRSSPAAS